MSLLLLWLSHAAWANNIQISNVSLTGQNTTNQTVLIQFDVSWENSWRLSVGPSNWDAAWLFVKYRSSGGSWNHASLNYVNGTAAADGHVQPAGGTITTPPDGRGVFLYRSADGSGDVNYTSVQILWNYGTDGVSDGQIVDVQVFGVEMAYVPQGSFYLGSAIFGTEAGRFQNSFLGNPYQIGSEASITISPATGFLYYNTVVGATVGDQSGPVPAAYPKGYNAFYCMKYEVSQGQYVDFFNTLTTSQRTDRDLSNANHKNSDGAVARNTFAYTSGNATTTTPDRPVNYVSNDDYLAYLDWAGLRPMSEFEFEKAAKGPVMPIVDMYAWGTANIHAPSSPFTLLNDGTSNSLVSDPGVNIGNGAYATTMSGLGGPLRCGIFAASATNPTRDETGGSYYGIMELSGNLYERMVSIGTPGGRSFTANHGDGALDSSGAHNVANWPAVAGGDIGYRGGSFANSANYLRIADRYDAANMSNIVNSRIGFRGVRTSP